MEEPRNSIAQNDFLKVVVAMDAVSDFIGKHAEEANRVAEATSDETR